MQKVCTKCQETKDINAYEICGGKWYKNICKECERTERLTRYQKNKEKNRAEARERYRIKKLNDPDFCKKEYIKYSEGRKKNSLIWYYNNTEKRAEYQKNYYVKNREKLLLQKKEYFQQNKKSIQRAKQTYARKLSAECPEFRIKRCLRARMKNALKGKNKSASTLELLGTDIVSYKKYLETKFKPGMSWDNYGSAWHIDHIIPLAYFKLSDSIEVQKAAFNYLNTQPLWAKENLSKGAKIIGA